MDAAVIEFSEKGFEGTSVLAIASRAGVKRRCSTTTSAARKACGAPWWKAPTRKRRHRCTPSR
ncbi:helix-turn-helix domain-containing protein [Variovorax sp. PAMC26660]|uniref:helix-turn-helix domain-containing protein n=1 Tax=Variovorax sp. PAMC26660 TaxID=2762322 RepID=UPI00164E8CA0|nr:helix-turn-helix transcriptional regulator [Variovorax sp. PAMC26660]